MYTILTIEEKNLIRDYISWYGDDECPPFEIDYFLRSWYENKEILYKVECDNIFVEVAIKWLKQAFIFLSYFNLIGHPCVATGGCNSGKPRRVETLMDTFGFGSFVFGYS